MKCLREGHFGRPFCTGRRKRQLIYDRKKHELADEETYTTTKNRDDDVTTYLRANSLHTVSYSYRGAHANRHGYHISRKLVRRGRAS